jgi:uncharacterized protein (DUF1778 family)
MSKTANTKRKLQIQAYPDNLEEIELIDRAAKKMKQSRSGFVVRSSLIRAKEVLE